MQYASLVPIYFQVNATIYDGILGGSKEKTKVCSLYDQTIKRLCQRLNIQKDVEVREKKSVFLAEAKGNHCFPGKATIIVSPFFHTFDDHEKEFILAHELCHIKSNDLILAPALHLSALTISTFAMSALFPQLALPSFTTLISKASFMGISVTMFSYNLYSKWRENCADEQAFSVCSLEGKKGAIRFFKKLIERQKELYQQGSESYDEEGEYTRYSRHPSLHSRLKKLELIMQTLNTKINDNTKR